MEYKSFAVQSKERAAVARVERPGRGLKRVGCWRRVGAERVARVERPGRGLKPVYSLECLLPGPVARVERPGRGLKHFYIAVIINRKRRPGRKTWARIETGKPTSDASSRSPSPGSKDLGAD